MVFVKTVKNKYFYISNMMSVKKIVIAVLFGALLSPVSLYAQEIILAPSAETFQKAKVLTVESKGTATILGTQTITPTQTLTVEILDGVYMGKVVTFENDYIQLSRGDSFYARYQKDSLSGAEYWSVSSPYRLDVLGWLLIAFIVLIGIFGGIQGVRGFASLIGSLFLIFYILVPGIYGGYNAVVISITVASLIIIIGSYITHGFNRTTTAAILGMILTIIFTGLLAYYVVDVAHLSGYDSDESIFLNLDTQGSIDMVGLLFGGIMIGLLGVLYDIAIGQAVAIEELFRAGRQLTRKEVYKRGIRIGREHIGALVNTLAIAYVGASLPLLLLMQNATTGILFIVNSEIFATEIVRILIGSIGLILAVPITTLIASHMLYGKETTSSTPTHKHSH